MRGKLFLCKRSESKFSSMLVGQMKPHFVFLLGLLALSGTSCQQGASSTTLQECSEGPLPLNAALEDIGFFFKTVEQVHPGHLANIPVKEYKSLKHRCREVLRLEDQRPDGISKSFLALTVAEAAASFGDGHTYCSPGLDLINVSDQSVLMPPFRLEWQAGHIVIADTIAMLKDVKGARLVKVNGIGLNEFLEPILTKISGKRKAHRTSRFLSNQHIYWALLQPVEQNNMEITIIRSKTEPETLNIDLINLPEYMEVFKLNAKKRPKSTHCFYHNDRTCYWQYNSFIYSEAGRRTVDAVFSEVRDKGTENLIIDLRFNGGGVSMAGDYLLNYITSKPYRMYSRTDTRISKQMPHKEELGIFAFLLRGQVIKWRGKATKPRDMGYRFRGSVYALIGPATFSSASDFAAVLEDFDIATLVGEETGGLRQPFGDCPRFTLPNSGLQFSVSHKRFFAPKPRPDDDQRGTVPDIAINNELLAPYMDADDPVLAFTMDMLEEQDQM